MKIYTKTGDKGETSLWGGRRVKKSDLQIEAYGTVDELNAHIGVLLAQMSPGDSDLKEMLGGIQNDLFTIGSMLAADPQSTKKHKLVSLNPTATTNLENEMDRLDQALSPLQNFILPSGSNGVAAAHVCRTVCRRAERRAVALDQGEQLDSICTYLNRLSDYFFVLARYIAFKNDVSEVIWRAPDAS